jgi:signal peptidase II
MWRWAWISVIVTVLDQATKLIASEFLTHHVQVRVLPFLNLTLVHNTGAAFGFLSSSSGWQNTFFIIVAVVASIAIGIMLRRLGPTERWTAAALCLILGGAIGNVIDRVIHGYVIDFIDCFIGLWHWPAFNIADSGITIGAAILVISYLRPNEGPR